MNRSKSLKNKTKIILNETKQVYYLVFGSKVECNICHYKASILESDIWHKYTVCPKCYSVVRHRLLWATLNSNGKYNKNNIIKGKAVLHFAPENVIDKAIEATARKYRTADFLAEGYLGSYRHIDYNMDISDMHQLKSEEFDCIIACDVLEHVYDDRKALREIYRVLTNGGYCILAVPQQDGLQKTYEDLSVIDPKERENKFGQSDHLRIYGNDFITLMRNAGFQTEQIDENYFDEKESVKNVLYPPVLSDHPLATNYRKIFIGHKS